MADYHVISLGAGVQSSTLLLMADANMFSTRPDFAVFADTGDEPDEVYAWLAYLQTISKIPIVITSKGKLSEDYLRAISGEGRAASIPFFTHNGIKKEGKLFRQCTRDYKIDQIWSAIRQELGYKPRQRFRDHVTMWIGISTDEIMRAKPSRKPYITHAHPLLDYDMSRADCLKWLKENGYPQAPKSSCYYCPYHSDRHWESMKEQDPALFKKACVFDENLRDNQRLNSKVYIHRSCKPLREVDFKPKDGEFDDTNYFNNECMGMCGV